MKRNGLFWNKFLLLAVILIAMLAMSGCRTRISNNSEVSNIYRDEDGIITETYQERRDELGLSTAEKPILPDFGSEEDPDDFDTSEDINFDYQEEEERDAEPQTNTNTNNNNKPNQNGNQSGQTGRGTTTTTYTVTFNPGKNGKITGKKKGEVEKKTVIKDGSVTILSDKDVTRKKHKLTGWKDDNGNKVAAGTSVKVTKNMTFTAQWEEEPDDVKPPQTQTFTVSFVDGRGNTLKAEEVEQGKAATPPSDPEWRGHKFSGWDTDFSVVNSNLTVTAKWSKGENLYDYWDETFKDKIKQTSTKPKGHVDREGGVDSKLVQDCNAYVEKEDDSVEEDKKFYNKDDCEFVIVFTDELEKLYSENPDESAEKEEAEKKRDAIIEKYKKMAEKNCLFIISKPSDKLTDKKESELAHQIIIANLLHNGILDEKEAKAAIAELGAEVSIYYPISSDPPQTGT
ncbi:MAG: InlB B-repeat-containing protein [Mogibacterium sp.]|nr:InlB B-repeat-containing protein [Mogibacterium sp.]